MYFTKNLIMLKKIKSSYLTKLIFSYVDEKPKLKLVKYNKSLQKKINLSIINYRHFKGRYIIYELNGIGKEYIWTNALKVEGERNGKGKE